jgi:hypothetical protein
MYPINRPEFMLANAAGYFDEAGKLKDEATQQRLRALIDALVQWTLKLKGGETVT